MFNKISVVIPTYNRAEQLSTVLDKLLESDVNGLESVEVIVVDDGSPQPAEHVVQSKHPRFPFTVRYIRQTNAGPAKARNTGFFASSSDIVLFIDDDILVEPDLIKQHINGHEEFRNSVIYGVCPLAPIYEGLPSKRYLDSLQAAHESQKGFKQQLVVNCWRCLG